MKKPQFFIFCFLLLHLHITAQVKQLEKALLKGKDNRNVYTAYFDKYVPDKNIVNWLDSKKYVLVNKTFQEFSRFGSYELGYSTLSFMTQSDYAYAEEQYRKQQIEQKQGTSFSEVLGIGIGAYLTYKAGKFLYNIITGNGNSTNNNTYHRDTESDAMSYGINIYRSNRQEERLGSITSSGMVYDTNHNAVGRFIGSTNNLYSSGSDARVLYTTIGDNVYDGTYTNGEIPVVHGHGREIYKGNHVHHDEVPNIIGNYDVRSGISPERAAAATAHLSKLKH